MKWTMALVAGWLALGGVAHAQFDGSAMPAPSACDFLHMAGAVDPDAAFPLAAEAEAPPESAQAAAPADTASSGALAPVDTTARTVVASPRRDGLGARAVHTVRAFASDLAYVAAAPFRLRRMGTLWGAGILATTAVIYANDEALLRAVVRNREEPVMKQIIHLGTGIEPVGFMGKTNPFYLGALGLGYAFRVEPLRQIPAEILESHLIAGGLRNIVKPLVGRRHPFEKQGAYQFDFIDGTSFPSGHTSVVYELATIASLHAHSLPVTIAAYSLATTVAIQRVESLNHWPSDVFIPAVTGTLIARAVVRRNAERRAADAGAEMTPWFSPDGRLLGLRVSQTF